jgi:8-oxo-dGTP pyrophosphatase MutT (NUDIX family)
MLQERSAGMVIFRKDEDNLHYLLLRYGWGHWGFPKGIIEEGETEKEAAIRETKEETGLSVFELIQDFKERIEYYFRKSGRTVHKEVVYFLAETPQTAITLSLEHSGHQWLSLNQAMTRLSFENDRRVLKKANRMLNQVGA